MQKQVGIIVVILLAAFAAFGLPNRQAVPPAEQEVAIIPVAPDVDPDDARGIYMTAHIGRGADGISLRKRNELMQLIKDTELNALVIDVKEAHGSDLDENLISFIESLKDEEVHSIARLTSFTDNSQVQEHPDWYLKYVGGSIWRDSRGNAWLDPSVPEVQQYIIDFAKEIIDLGVDEIQFDYIRYPSDGAISSIADSTPNRTNRSVITEAFKNFSEELRAYNKNIKLSVDLFGYTTQRPGEAIGQGLEDPAPYMDYISPMVYPSHYYSGFFEKADPSRGLPVVNLNATSSNSNPATVVYRSMLSAEDMLYAITTTPVRAKLRPWLQSFSYGGVYYDKDMIRGQIDAAAEAGNNGYLLWNASNRYNKESLNLD